MAGSEYPLRASQAERQLLLRPPRPRRRAPGWKPLL